MARVTAQENVLCVMEPERVARHAKEPAAFALLAVVQGVVSSVRGLAAVYLARGLVTLIAMPAKATRNAMLAMVQVVVTVTGLG